MHSAQIDPAQVSELAYHSAKWAAANLLDRMSYQNMCAAYGILKVAEALDSAALFKAVEHAFYPELYEGRYPHRDNASRNPAHRWFGILPLEMFRQSVDGRYHYNPSLLDRGLQLSDEQFMHPTEYGMPGYTPRGYVDDMYGATVMQSLAYACTGNQKYLDRAILQVLFYAGHYMQENGLFVHSPRSPFFWGRGNGWCASAFAELLTVMPEDHPMRETVLLYYRRMMDALVEHQADDGMWYQLVDDHDSWPETSCTAMFTYAMAEGVRNGWIPAEPYGSVLAEAWMALSGYVDDHWRLRQVIRGTSVSTDREKYLERRIATGDAHGQAPLLWAATAMLKLYAK